MGPIVMRILASPAKLAAHDESMGLVQLLHLVDFFLMVNLYSLIYDTWILEH